MVRWREKIFTFHLLYLKMVAHLPHPSKTQYVQILNIVYTSTKHQISDQSTPMFDMVDTAFSNSKSIDHLLISSRIFQGKRK